MKRWPLWFLGLGLAAWVAAPARGDNPPIPEPSPLTPASPYGTGANLYDLAPAYGRAAYFDEQYQRTYAELQMVIVRLRKEYLRSDEYRAANQTVAETKAAYAAARAPVLQALAATPEYRAVVEKRVRLGIALQQKLPAVDVAALAERKMEYGAAASRMEAEALNSDPAVRQTLADYLAAQADLNNKLARSEATIDQQPAYVQAKQAYDFARDNRAGAQGVLAGAWISRCDAVDADRRRYPGPTGNTVAPLIIDGGFWQGYYGNVGAVRPF